MIQEEKKLEMFYKYKIASLLTGVGIKNYYLSYMHEHKDLQTKINAFEKVFY